MKIEIPLHKESEEYIKEVFSWYKEIDELPQSIKDGCIIHIYPYADTMQENYDLTKWMVENDRWANIIYLHTSNPVGRANMFQLLNRYKPEHVKVYNSPIPNYLLKDEDYL